MVIFLIRVGVEEQWISAKVKKMGTYQLIIDTIPPKIIQLGNNSEKYPNQSLNFRVTDKLSGVDNYHVYIDNQWVLSNYSYKTSKLQVPLDSYANLSYGKHKCSVLYY